MCGRFNVLICFLFTYHFIRVSRSGNGQQSALKVHFADIQFRVKWNN